METIKNVVDENKEIKDDEIKDIPEIKDDEKKLNKSNKKRKMYINIEKIPL